MERNDRDSRQEFAGIPDFNLQAKATYEMKWLKYFGIAVCVLLIVEALPSVFLITQGLIIGKVDDPLYFGGKLAVYIAMIAVLTYVSVKLFRSARG